jgi:subtilisin family serine protease
VGRGGFLIALAVALIAAGTAVAVTPTDPLWSRSWAQRTVHMPRAWDVTTGSPKIVVAVIDSGVQRKTEDLKGALVPGWDFVENDASTEDKEGHGTMVATIIAGRGNDGVGTAGYCWKCKIMPLRVSAYGTAGSTVLANAVKYAVDHGARVVNIDFSDGGTQQADPKLTDAIAYAAEHNVVVVASAGNTGSDVGTHPASAAGAIAVAATNIHDQLTPWSTRGNWVPLAAPGCQISVNQRGLYGFYCGTSSAAPTVSGVVGLLLSAKPQLTPVQVLRALKSSAKPVPGIGGGRVDAYAALVAVGAVPGSSPTPPGPPGKHQPRATPGPRAKVVRGRLARHVRIPLKVRGGRLSVSLSSKMAHACSFTLSARGDIWFSVAKGKTMLGLATTVPAGRYVVKITCVDAGRARFSLTARALFA